MSLHAAAQHLANKGRGRDTTLVHMSPREVQGLQALARAQGGSLTVNPQTGLVEAGFLEQILPVVAAAAATYFTAGAAAPALAAATGMGATSAGILAGAGSGALISGATAAAQGKDAGKAALMGGIGGAISGGLGAYDAAPNLLEAGSKAPVVTEGATNVASNSTITPEMASKLTSADTAQLNQLAAQQSSIVPPNTPVSQMTPTQYAAAGSSRFGAPVGAQDLSTGIGTPPASSLEGAANASKTLSTPTSYYGNLAPDAYFQKAAIQSLPALGLVDDENKGAQVTPEEQSRLKRISPNFRAQMPIQPNPYYNAQYPTYAAGGLAALQGGGPVERMTQMNTAMNPQGGLYPQGMIDKTQYATPTQRPTSLEVVESEPSYDARVNPVTGTLMAGGGLADLGTYSDGGRMLKGRGDGMSDSIPGIIGNKQPARLADGEFVVPADVVSHLGNGSTDAGAKRLYSMMDRVRQARTGKKAQAPAVNPAKMMPA